MTSPERHISRTFVDFFGPDAAAAASDLLRSLSLPAPRPYHNARHVSDVAGRVIAWSQPEAPSRALVAAALYHDVIYDPRRDNNEILSMAACHNALTGLGVALAEIREACDLIWATAFHEPRRGTPEEILLLDADNFILGETPTAYEAYRRAVRQEYAHVDDAAWKTGRAAVLQHFLAHPRLYHGTWAGRDTHEARARANMAAELATLAPSRLADSPPSPASGEGQGEGANVD